MPVIMQSHGIGRSALFEKNFQDIWCHLFSCIDQRPGIQYQTLLEDGLPDILGENGAVETTWVEGVPSVAAFVPRLIDDQLQNSLQLQNNRFVLKRKK